MKLNIGNIVDAMTKYAKLKDRINYYLDILRQEAVMLKSPQLQEAYDELKKIADSLP